MSLTPGVVYIVDEPGAPDTCKNGRHVEVSWNETGPPGTMTGHSAECPLGKTAISGGWRASAAVQIFGSGSFFLTSWGAGFLHTLPNPVTVTLYALCATIG